MPISKMCYVPKLGNPGFNINEKASENVFFKVNQRLEAQATFTLHTLGSLWVKGQSAIDFGLTVESSSVEWLTDAHTDGQTGLITISYRNVNFGKIIIKEKSGGR